MLCSTAVPKTDLCIRKKKTKIFIFFYYFFLNFTFAEHYHLTDCSFLTITKQKIVHFTIFKCKRKIHLKTQRGVGDFPTKIRQQTFFPNVLLVTYFCKKSDRHYVLLVPVELKAFTRSSITDYLMLSQTTRTKTTD